jgi:hypothetical protein
VKTKPTIKARCVYKIGQRQGQQRQDSTLPAWSSVSTSFVPTEQTQTQQSIPSPRATSLSEVEIDIDTQSEQTTNTSNSLTPATAEMTDDRIRRTVEETIEISLHKFVAEQTRQQSQQMIVRQTEASQHAQRLDAIERLIMTMATRQNNIPSENQIGHKSDNSSRSDLTPSKSLDLRRIALGQDEEFEQNEPEQGDKKLKKQKTTKGASNVLPATPTQVERPASTEASGDLPRQVVKPIVQTTLKVTKKSNEVKTRSMRQTNTQEPPPMAEEVMSKHKTTSNSAP